MTVTDELRRMLDERGVEWEDGGEGLTIIPAQDGVPRAWTVNTWPSGKDMGDCLWVQNRHPLTPEQAIAATLGQGTCHLKEIDKDCDTASEYMIASEWCFDAVYRCSCGCRFGHISHDRPRYCPNCGARCVW